MRDDGYCDPGVLVGWSYNQKHVADEIKSLWDMPRHDTQPIAASTLVEVDTEARFRTLEEEWSREVGNVSSVTALTSHPKYQEIIALGWAVVPYMLADLQKKRGFWFPALNAITGIRPFDPSDAGNSKRMIEAWINWGKKKEIKF